MPNRHRPLYADPKCPHCKRFMPSALCEPRPGAEKEVECPFCYRKVYIWVQVAYETMKAHLVK